jgi:hypothetical protein
MHGRSKSAAPAPVRKGTWHWLALVGLLLSLGGASLVPGLSTPVMGQSAPDQVSINIFDPACNCGDVLNSAIVIGLSIQSTTSSIATVNPATVSAAANTSISSTATISTPTTTGTYTLIVSANGFSTFVSTVVTVQ